MRLIITPESKERAKEVFSESYGRGLRTGAFAAALNALCVEEKVDDRCPICGFKLPCPMCRGLVEQQKKQIGPGSRFRMPNGSEVTIVRKREPSVIVYYLINLTIFEAIFLNNINTWFSLSDLQAALLEAGAVEVED